MTLRECHEVICRAARIEPWPKYMIEKLSVNLIHQSWCHELWITIGTSNDKMNDWEREFVYSIKQKLLYGHFLSHSEASKLEEIYAEKTPT